MTKHVEIVLGLCAAF